MKRYQAVAFLLSTAMTVSSVAPVFGASNDVFGHWAELTITKWQNEGRIGGYEDGTFKPDKAITRAEFVRLLNSAAPTAFTASTSINFSDVKESDWFYADVAKAVGGRVASGFEDGTFRPGETVTRMQAAVFICNAKGLTPNEAAANNFTDAASIPAWAKGAVGAAVAAGYLSGYPDGSFGGSKGMTRAEAVSTLDRVLGGGSTTTTTPSGEIDTSDRDNSNTEDNRTAEAGNMVWTSGGGGGSSKKSSSSSSSSSDKKTHNVTIRSQKEANDYEGKTLTGTTEIYVDGSGIDLKDIRFKGDVDIYADDTVAAAYIGKDTAVAAANSTVDIYFEGKTNVSGTITVIRNNVAGADKVVIRTRTPRALSASVLAKVATKIVGFEISRVEAQAPVEIAEGTKVNTVEAGDNASVEVAEDASVDKVDVTGDAKDIVLNGEGSTDVTVKSGASADNIVVDSTEATVELEGSAKVDSVAVVGDGAAAVKVNDNAKVENVQVSDNASADVAVADKATVNKVELSDTATAKVEVAEDAKVNTISSTSTGKTEVSGEGTVDKIEATDPSTVDTSNAGENIPTVDKKEEDKPVTPATTTITAAQLKDVALTTPKAASEKASVTGLPTGVKQEGTTWTAASTPAAQAGEAGDGTTGGDTGSEDSGTTTPDDSNDSGTDTPTTPGTSTTKAHTATITLTADTGYVFDTTIDKTAFTGLGTAVTDAKTTASTITLTVTADIAVTPEDPDTPVDPPEETNPQITSITAKVGDKTTTNVEVSATDDVTVTLEAAVNADIADASPITWDISNKDGITNAKLAVSPTSTEVSSGKATTTLTVPANVVTGTDTKTITVTATYDNDGTDITKEIQLTLATTEGMANVTDSITIAPTTSTETGAIDLTTGTNAVTRDFTITVQNSTPAGIAGKDVALSIKETNKQTGTGVALKTADAKTDTNGAVEATLTVDPNEENTTITVVAKCDSVEKEFPVTVTTKTAASVTVAPTTVTLEDEATAGDKKNEKEVVFTLSGAKFKDTVTDEDVASYVKGTDPTSVTKTVTVDKTDANAPKVKVKFTSDRNSASSTDATAKYSLEIQADKLDAADNAHKVPTAGLKSDEVTVTVKAKAGSTEGATVAATAAGEVTGTTTNNTFTIDLPSTGYKFVSTLENTLSDTIKGWFTAPTTADLSELTFAVARTSDTKATITVTGTVTKAVTADTVTIDGSKLKSLIVKDDTDSTALGDKDTVTVTATGVKFNIPNPGGDSGNTDTAISSFALTGLSATGLKVGETIPELTTSAAKCDDIKVTWTKESASETITAGNSKFGAGTYKAVVVVKTTNTKGFADAVTSNITFGDNLGDIVTLNSSDAAPELKASSTDAGAVKDTLTFTLDVTIAKEKLASLAITGLSEPESGSTTITESNVKLSPDTEARYTIKTKPSSWTEADSKFTADITFEITGDAAKNYVFDTKNVELNAGTFTKGSATAEVKGTAGEAEVTFTITYTPTSNDPVEP